MKTNGKAEVVEAEAGEDGALMAGGGSRPEEHCGLGSCQPRWARIFESTHVFMVVFLSGWVLQGMFYTYFVSVITTIEKLFRIKSKTTGTLLAATEVGQICTALLLTYFAGRGHRPRWIACGMVLFALGCLGCALPHFMLGGRLLESSRVLRGGNSSAPGPAAAPAVCGAASAGPGCEAHVLEEQAAHQHMTDVVLPIFFACLFAVGVGQTAISTLGIPYIDDNVASRESPLYMAITIGVRIVGPAGGFILGSFCTRVYADLSSPPGLHPTDPSWVGAWWLGLVLVSSLLLLMGLCMFCFPRQLPSPRGSVSAVVAVVARPSPPPKGPQLKDFPRTLRRQLGNDILMFRTASCVLHLLPVAGLYTFLPKYLESQFRLPTHDANLISGIGGILVMGVGIMLSGAVILKLVPTARFVAGWIAFTALVYSSGMLILMFVGCPMDDLVGLSRPLSTMSPTPMPALSLESPFGTPLPPLPSLPYLSAQPACQASCSCDRDKFGVVCGQDGKTYFSACHAGCHNVSLINEKFQYSNCQCVTTNNHTADWDSWGNFSIGEKGGGARGGYCPGNCSSFVLFICVFSFIMFIHATGEVGSILLIMRCTDPKDKAMAMGIIQFAIGLFGNVPCPIIFGVVVDSACLLWDSICNTKGACMLYDSDVFRQFFLGTTGGIMGLAFLVDLVVWYKASKIDINPSQGEEGGDPAKGELPPSQSPLSPLTSSPVTPTHTINTSIDTPM